MNWQKGNDESNKRKSKKTQKALYKDDLEDNNEPVLKDIPSEKMFICAVSLAEINRKLGIVMWTPSMT